MPWNLSQEGAAYAASSIIISETDFTLSNLLFCAGTIRVMINGYTFFFTSQFFNQLFYVLETFFSSNLSTIYLQRILLMCVKVIVPSERFLHRKVVLLKVLELSWYSLSVKFKGIKFFIDDCFMFQFGGSEAILTALSDQFPRIVRDHREIFIACLFSFYFLVGLAFTSQVT